MSFYLNSDPRELSQQELDIFKEMSLRKQTFPGESVVRLIGHLEWLTSHDLWLLNRWHRVQRELERAEEFISRHELIDEWECERDGCGEYEADPPVSASWCRQMNAGINP